MAICDGCAVNFCHMNGSLCRKCVKLEKAQSDVERNVIVVSFLNATDAILKLYINFRINRSVKVAL
jgi:hypothetical protein